MKKEKKYIEYILKQAEALLAIDSPSGFHRESDRLSL